MMFLKRRYQPFERCNAIDPNLDTENNCMMNDPLALEFIRKWTMICADRQKYKQKCSEYFDFLPSHYIPATTYTWDQELEDSYEILLGEERPLWEKRGYRVRDTLNNEEWPHDARIDAGWNYLRICYNPDPPLPQNPHLDVVYETTMFIKKK